MNLQTLFRLAAWSCALVIAALSVVSPRLRPTTFIPHDLEHAAIFALTGFALAIGYPGRTGLQLAGVVVFAALIEVAQFMTPGRHPTMHDFIVDATAACIGVLAATIVTQVWRMWRAKMA